GGAMTVASVLSGAARWHVEQGEAREFIRSLPDACVDALICDPPYSSGGQFRGDRAAPTTEKYGRGDALDKRIEFTGDNRDQRSFLAWCSLWLRSEEHTSELQSRENLVCRLLLEKKKQTRTCTSL